MNDKFDLTYIPTSYPTPAPDYQITGDWIEKREKADISVADPAPLIYINSESIYSRIDNAEIHHALFYSSPQVLLFLWIAGHLFSQPNPQQSTQVSACMKLNPAEILRASTFLNSRGYIRSRHKNDVPYLQLTHNLPLSKTPPKEPGTDLCIELNAYFWSLFSADPDRLAVILWIGLNNEISNGLQFVVFPTDGIPGLTKDRTDRVFESLCDEQLLKELNRREPQQIDCRVSGYSNIFPHRSPNGKVALVRRHPFTTVPSTPFPTPEPTDPDIRYIFRGPIRRPDLISVNPDFTYSSNKYWISKTRIKPRPKAQPKGSPPKRA